MQLFTKLDIKKLPFTLQPQDQIISVGSCFAVHMGSHLQNAGFSSLVNPFGTIFNSISLAKNIVRAIQGRAILPNEIHENKGVFYHYDLHSSLNTTSVEDFLNQANDALHDFRKKASKAKVMIITLGTAKVHEQVVNGQIVANCHKQPQQQFSHRLLSKEEVMASVSVIVEILKTVNSDIELVLTVSPVRHTKDGIVQNSLSKAILVQAANELTDKHDNVSYFPAYEIMLDELRDYRFYEADLIHPNPMAVEIIWEYFRESVFGEKAKEMEKEIVKYRKSAAHRPFRSESEEHEAFVTKLAAKKQELIKKWGVQSL